MDSLFFAGGFKEIHVGMSPELDVSKCYLEQATGRFPGSPPFKDTLTQKTEMITCTHPDTDLKKGNAV